MDRQIALMAYSVGCMLQGVLSSSSSSQSDMQHLCDRLFAKGADKDSLQSELAQLGLDLNVNIFVGQWIERFARMYAVLNYDCGFSIEEAEGKMRNMHFILFSHIHSVAEKEGVSPLIVWERVEQGDIFACSERQSFSQRDAGEVHVTQTSYVPESGTQEGLPPTRRAPVGGWLGPVARKEWNHRTEQEQASADAVPA